MDYGIDTAKGKNVTAITVLKLINGEATIVDAVTCVGEGDEIMFALEDIFAKHKTKEIYNLIKQCAIRTNKLARENGWHKRKERYLF